MIGKYLCLTVLAVLIFFLPLQGQLPLQPHPYSNASEIWLGLQRLRTVGTVLYVAAHPDDENTRLITWFTQKQHCRTAYISLTRGDGGQNLIGEEIEEQLGIIRTQELMSARRIDRGEQYFSRAIDFGYSKTAEETFNIWNREQTLEDLVWTIRSLRPDIIVTRFSPEPGGTHGHHTASTVLALEAYEAAGDPTKFPDQLKLVKPWKARRVLWNTSSWFFKDKAFPTEGLLRADVGEYVAPTGESVTETAARSRSQHKSQGFGTVGERGETIEYLQHLAGNQAVKGIFEGIDLSWNRVPQGTALARLADNLVDEFRPASPEALVPKLLQFYKRLETLDDPELKRYKMEEVRNLIAACLGLYMCASVPEALYAPGEEVALNFEVIQRQGPAVILRRVALPELKLDSAGTNPMRLNIRALWNPKFKMPALPSTQPYWLVQPTTTGMFVVENPALRCLPENPPALTATVEIEIEGNYFTWTLPVICRKSDPVGGEIRQPVAVGYPVYLSMEQTVRMFPEAKPGNLSVRVTAGQTNVATAVRLRLPQGWKSEPKEHKVKLGVVGSDTVVTFLLTPPATPGSGEVVAEAQLGDRIFDRGKVELDYDHIQNQTLFPLASARVVRADLKKTVNEIGYIEGAGDLVDEGLQMIGINVVKIAVSDIQLDKLKKYKAIVVGIRAYNTVDALAAQQSVLMEYVRQGGTLVVQYNTSHRLVTEDLAPYKLKLSRDRVTDENATMKLLQPNHRLMQHPNAISQKDFEGWVQERGLYFPNEWGGEFTPLFSCADPGEAESKGSLLYAKYGEGHYIYTGLSFFRELPSGVPGAYRLLVNLISVGTP